MAIAIDPGRSKAQQAALAEIEKKYGKNAVMRLGDKPSFSADNVLSTGALALDIALGIGGLPRGRIVEIFGAESSGKSTLCQHIIAEVQRQGGTAAYIDAEHALDPDYAGRCGVNVNDLFLAQPDHGEQALDICEVLIRSGGWHALVVDSVAALTPKTELEGEIGDSIVGVQARLMSQAMRKLTSVVAQTNTLLIFTNQLREKIGVMFGNPETTPGGRALKFYSSVRIELRRAEQIKAGTDVIGMRCKAKVVKNKVAPPFRIAEFDILFKEGISREGTLLDIGVESGVLKKAGAFLSYGDIRLGQGRENARQFLKDNREVFAEIDRDIREKVLGGQIGLHVGGKVADAEGDESES